METYSALLAICVGNSLDLGEFPSQRPLTNLALTFSLICVWINDWVNNREAGDLRRYHSHYDVIVMFILVDNGRPFAEDIFRGILLNDKFCILIKIPQMFVPEDLIDNKLHWFRSWLSVRPISGDKPISEPMRTNVHDVLWHYLATMSSKEINDFQW